MVGSGMRRRWNGTSSEERVVSDQRIPISLANYSLDSKSSPQLQPGTGIGIDSHLRWTTQSDINYGHTNVHLLAR